MRKLLILLLIPGHLVLTAQSGSVSAAPVSVELSSFEFSPKALHLRAGQPVTLHLHNASGGGHNFSAPEFFAAATLSPAMEPRIRQGVVEIPSRGSIDLTLTPAAGHYRLKCTHAFHSTFGMKGEIIVD